MQSIAYISYGKQKGARMYHLNFGKDSLQRPQGDPPEAERETLCGATFKTHPWEWFSPDPDKRPGQVMKVLCPTCVHVLRVVNDAAREVLRTEHLGATLTKGDVVEVIWPGRGDLICTGQIASIEPKERLDAEKRPMPSCFVVTLVPHP